jgi:tetratricopeptide (TPR) repeat protein/predicted Ser/Thr protein kinase
MLEADPLVGATVADGRYQIQRLLGAGGMGSVYLARQVSMDRLVALKLITGQAGTEGRDTARRFHQEMRITAKIEHPNTIRVYDYGETGGRLYLAMEYLEGKSLRAVILADRPLAVARSLHIATQMAKALVAAHQEGVVHRDLKPENIILLDRYGEQDFVKILDFGIARSLDPGAERLTVTGGIIGTPSYMAPEQASGQPVDGRTDLYALGTILYEMLTGGTPFQKPTAMSQLVAQMTEPPPPILDRLPTLSPSLAALIDKLLAKQPDDRPASAQAVLTRLVAELELVTGTGPAAGASGAAPSRATLSMLGPQSVSQGYAATALLAGRAATEILSPASSQEASGARAPTPAVSARRADEPILPNLAMSPGALGTAAASAPQSTGASAGVRSTPASIESSGAHPAWKWLLPAVALALVGLVVALVLRRGPSVAAPVPDASPKTVHASVADRAVLDGKLRASGEPLPPAACASQDAATVGKLAAAFDRLQPSGGGAPDPKQAVALLADTDEASAERWLMVARAQLAEGDDAQASGSAERALALCPSYAAASNVLGKSFQHTGKLDQAEQAFRRAIESDKDYAAPHFNLALLALKRGDAKGSIAMLTGLAERTPTVPHLFLVRGQARLLAKDLPGAEADLRQAVVQDAADADAWRLLGELLSRTGRKTEAHDALCRAKGLGAAVPGLSCKP